MTHWAAEYIGQPWVAGESDCWHFAVRVWADRFGWDVPVSAVNPLDARAVRRRMAQGDWHDQWEPVPTPVEGDAVLMRRGHWPSHVGIWVTAQGGSVLHSVEGTGVICTQPARLVDMGFTAVGMYRWRAAA